MRIFAFSHSAHAQKFESLHLYDPSWTTVDMVSSGAIVLLTICLLPGVVHGWWPFSSSEEESTSDIAPAKKPATFEMATAEQKFLNEAQQLLDLAPLDKCLHGVSCIGCVVATCFML